jgi:hypothetical protein
MLLSTFFVLATAGATIDGRNIEEQWLKDIAEQYDLETYTANINVDHYNWYGNYGQVVEVRLGENKEGKTTLEGRINPNQFLLQQNKAGQKLFFSAEITPNFADTGKAYLTGLAMTDQPASLGTSQAKFSKNDNATQLYTKPQEYVLDIPSEDKTNSGDEEESTENLLARLFKKIGISPKKEFTQKPKDQEETDMSKEDLEKLQAQSEATNQSIVALTGAVTGLVEKLSQTQGKGSEEEPEKEESEIEKLSKQVVELGGKVEKLSQEKPAKFKGENLGDNTDTLEYA